MVYCWKNVSILFNFVSSMVRRFSWLNFGFLYLFGSYLLTGIRCVPASCGQHLATNGSRLCRALLPYLQQKKRQQHWQNAKNDRMNYREKLTQQNINGLSSTRNIHKHKRVRIQCLKRPRRQWICEYLSIYLNCAVNGSWEEPSSWNS